MGLARVYIENLRALFTGPFVFDVHTNSASSQSPSKKTGCSFLKARTNNIATQEQRKEELHFELVNPAVLRDEQKKIGQN